MKEEEVRGVVRATVRETLTSLGFDTDNPLETQNQQAFLRNLYHNHQGAKKAFRDSIIRWSIPPIMFATWETIKRIF